MNEQKQAGCGASCAKKGASPVDFRAKLSSGSSVKKVIGIVSGREIGRASCRERV